MRENDQFEFAYNYIENCKWLERECDKVTTKYWDMEARIVDKDNITDEDSIALEKTSRHMEELENRLMFEEREYARIRKKIDEMEF